MKRDLLIAAALTALVAAISYGAALTGTNIAAPVVPFTDADTYPSHEAKYGKGGYIQAQSTSVSQIPLTRRADGMLVYATQWDKYYRLASGTWQQQSFIQLPQFNNFSTATHAKIVSIPVGPQGPRGYDGFDGATGTPALTCWIDSGPLAWTYDQYGLLPVPAMFPYTAKLYVQNTPVTPATYHWRLPGSNTLLAMGQYSTQASFSPTRFGIYSASKSNNWIAVDLTYGGMNCRAVAPIAATKIGAQGIQGIPGDLSNLTRGDITTHLAEPSNTAVTLQPATSSPTTEMFSVREYGGSVRNYIDAQGYQYFKDANGWVLAKIQTDGTLLLLDQSGVTRFRADLAGQVTLADKNSLRRVFVNATTATIQTFRRDGTTIGFQIFSSGRWVGAEGQPGSNGQCLAADTNGRRYWTTCGAGGGTPGGSSRQVQWNNGGSFSGFGRYSANDQALIVNKLVIQ